MNPTHFSPLILNLFILILFLLSYNSIEAVDKFYQTCSVPKTCGDNQNITFPFYIQGLQEPYCGYPGFQLSCNNNGHPILNLSNESYTIHKIFYQNQSLIVSNSALSNPQTDCIPFVQNLTLSVDYPLQITPNQSQVILLYNCNSSLLKAFPKYNDIGCSVENRTRKIVGLSEKDITQMGNNVSKCGKENLVVAPVMSYNLGDHENEINIREILNRGFLMKWTASNCSFCERSGGRCGFDRFNFLFKCYCPDRPHSARCDPLHHDDWRYEACHEPTNCGSGPNTSYPFYLSSADRVGRDFCGRKGFETECQDGKPVFKTSRGCYIVKDISYKQQWFRLLDADVANSSTSSFPKHYFAFNRSLVEFNSNHANLQFFYGCNNSFAPSFEKSRVSCAPSNVTDLSYVALILKDEDLDNATGCDLERSKSITP